MKKLLLSIIVILLTVAFTSCSAEFANMGMFEDNDEKKADETFRILISAVELKDDSKLVDMFSNAVRSENDLSQSAEKFVDYIHGDIVSLSSARESGVGSSYTTENGKRRKEIQSSFCINTTENAYYIAMKECVIDEFDKNNIGLLSIYIIESNNWTVDCVYRGDGKWTKGINIFGFDQTD